MPSSSIDISSGTALEALEATRALGIGGNSRPLWEWPNGLSVVIPAWNEERRLSGALDQYLHLFEAYGLPFEVIVVVDGATDRTSAIASGYSERGVRVLEFEEKLGKGGAVLAGFRRAKFDIVGFLDADAPITPVNVAYMIADLTTADGVIASRWADKSVMHRGRPLSRRFFSRVWNLMARAVLGLNLQDTQCGAKFFRREAVAHVLDQVILTNWAFDASLLFHFKHAGFSISEVPVNWTHDGDSKLKLESVVPAMFLSLVGIRLMSLPILPRATRAWAGWLYQHLAR